MSDETPPPPPSEEAIRATQRARARVTALLLGAFVVLVFAIALVKMQAGTLQ